MGEREPVKEVVREVFRSHEVTERSERKVGTYDVEIQRGILGELAYKYSEYGFRLRYPQSEYGITSKSVDLRELTESDLVDYIEGLILISLRGSLSQV